jgi:hypothetical protein
MISALDLFHVLAFWRTRPFGEIPPDEAQLAEAHRKEGLAVEERRKKLANDEHEQFNRGNHLSLPPLAGPKAPIRICAFERDSGGFQFLFFRK